MAAVTELCFLLLLLISNSHNEERITIKQVWTSYRFTPPRSEASHCLISRFVGEEKLVLWNISDLWTENSTAPEDLKERFSVKSKWSVFSYRINNLTYSDSGLYQEKCWTEGTETHKKNIRIIVCDTINVIITRKKIGHTVDLPCGRAADNLTHLWLKREPEYPDNTWTRVFGDSSTSVTDDNKGRFQVDKSTSALRINNFTMRDFLMSYNCLKMNQQQCVSSVSVSVSTEDEFLFYTVGDTAVLQCSVSDFSDSRPPVWRKDHFIQTDFGQNHSLIISPLMLNHSGWYNCETFRYSQYFLLFVCPEFGPSVVQLFSEGEDVTLTCGDSLGEEMFLYWFMKSERTNGQIFSVNKIINDLNSRFTVLDSDESLIISNVSVKDTGEYWCVATDPDLQCLSTVRYVVKSRDPFGISSTFYRVWSSLLTALLMMLCVVVAVVNYRTRRPEQL